MAAPARVLVVDDSPTMRGLITAVLSQDPDVSVIGQAGDAMEARAAIKQLNPDVVTLDIEMPNMNGLEFLEKIMKLRPMPVIMVSTMTHRGAEATLAALEIGAFDCVAKPQPGDARPFGELAEKVKAAARSQHRHSPVLQAPTAAVSPAADFRVGRKIVAIGSSTGGVEALIAVLQKFPRNCPPTVITQHMPPTFTKSFAERLNRLCAPWWRRPRMALGWKSVRSILRPVAIGIFRWPTHQRPAAASSSARQSTATGLRLTCCSIRLPNSPAATQSVSF